jgi:hypothetical protein
MAQKGFEFYRNLTNKLLCRDELTAKELATADGYFEKRCTQCKKRKLFGDFHNQPSGRYRKISKCSDCHNANQVKSKLDKREEQKKQTLKLIEVKKIKAEKKKLEKEKEKDSDSDSDSD